MNDLSNYSSDPLAKAAEKIKGDTGKRPLSEDEILVLACDEISHTYARAEKNYKS
jgi:serine/threonine protein phosphatase PrpC